MERQLAILRILIVVGFWILVFVTFRIWVGTGNFPTIPMLGKLAEVPLWVDWILLALLAGTSTAIFFSKRQTAATLVSAGVLVALIILNQHRLQPWAYLTLIQLFVLGSRNDRLSIALMRAVIVSIYVFSAISKFDFAFFEHQGLRFTDTLLGFVGGNPHLMAPRDKSFFIWAIPIGELVVGLGLGWRGTRRFAVGLSLVLHAILIVVLGPLGLNHHSGVLIWNSLFAAQVLVLFGWQTPIDQDDQQPSSIANYLAIVVATVACLLPIGELFGYVDHWPAWSLYSDRTEKVELFIDAEEAHKLPPELLKHLGPPLPLQTWRKFYLEQYSLAATRAPIYPEDRFQTGVANAVIRRCTFINWIWFWINQLKLPRIAWVFVHHPRIFIS